MDNCSEVNRKLVTKMLAAVVGIEIKVLNNECREGLASSGDSVPFQDIRFQVLDEEPDDFAFELLFALSLMSFTYANPKGYTGPDFIPDDEYCIGYFLEGLSYENGSIYYSTEFISGRCIKTDITYEQGGMVTLSTTDRGSDAEYWLSHLQDVPHNQ